MTLATLRGWIINLSGWRRRAFAFAAGAVSVLALAPFFIWPVLFLTLPVLVWLIDASVRQPPPVAGWRGSPMVRAAGAGWWFGFGYFSLGLFWIGEAFLVEADKFAWALPFAVTLMPAGLSLFYAAAAAAASRYWRPGLSRVLVLSIALAVAEWLRGHVLTGFPWSVLGYALTWPLPLMQSAGLVGIYGLTLWAVLVFAAPLVVLAERDQQTWRSVLPGAAVAAVPLAVMALYGAIGLATSVPDTDGARVRIVQPSVPQREKWLPQNQRAIFDKHLDLSRRDSTGAAVGLSGIDIVVWPEAAMPFLPLEQPAAISAINDLLSGGGTLIAGALRRQPNNDQVNGQAGAGIDYFNSLMVFSAAAAAPQVYDKIHLVPFGEYLPLRPLLEVTGLGGLARMRGGFTSGPTPRPLLDAGRLAQFSPLICYEAVFPAAIVQGERRPRVMVNLTNDGWFGNTTGPRQHLHQSRVRAVEEGVPLIRAANNGISALIDANGRILASLGMNASGTIEGVVPPPRAVPPYGRYGDWLFVANLLLFTLWTLYLAPRKAARSP